MDKNVVGKKIRVPDCQENSRKNTEIFFTVCILMRLYKNGNAKLLNNKVVNNGNL